MPREKKSVILIGAGLRGKTYTDYILRHPGEYELIAVAEPVDDRRNYIKEKHGLPEEMCFTDWRPLLAMPRLSDACFICTMDRDHFAPAMAAIDRGYEILLEKPAAATPEECLALAGYAEAAEVNVLVCHVLRYTPFFMGLKNLIDTGTVGRVMQIRHTEDVGHIHQSHSFVRGNWSNSGRATPMILQKSCHDMDILQWLVGTPCTRVQSFGALTHFTPENRPAGAPDRCIDGCPVGESCPYNAVKLYLENEKNSWFRTSSTQKVSPTNADVEQALRTTNYGRCVYACDNDVVDHQVVNLEFDGPVYANFSMTAFNRGGREITVMGTEGTIHGKMSEKFFTVFSFADSKTRQIDIADAMPGEMITSGHGGGDEGIMNAFFARLRGEYRGKSVCSLREACENHLIAFAAEESRLTGRVVDMAEYAAKIAAHGAADASEQ